VAVGWTQQELADRAGVTRSLVAAVEAGRQQPSVTAALGLARALGTSVEGLFAAGATHAVPVVGDAHPPGSAVLTVRVGDRLVSESTTHRAASPEQWATGDAVVGAGGLEWLPGGRTDGVAIAGCDPALGLLAELVARTSHHRVVAVHASTGRALEALAAGTVHGVLVHAGAGGLPPAPVPVRRWHVARWAVGLASATGVAPPTIEELAERGATVAQRDGGAGSQLALVRALREAGVEGALAGPTGDGHLDVARRVRTGQVDAGVTMEAAARTFDLGFRPLEVHEAELWVDERHAALAEVAALGSALCGSAFLRRAELLPGYDVDGCGTERSAS
jgi:DNA-binding XRE family transcriptional regulator